MALINDISVIKKMKKSSSILGFYGVNNRGLNRVHAMNGIIVLNQLSDERLNLIKSQINFLNSLVHNKTSDKIQQYVITKNYRGMRHVLKLPVRGQRTHTNASTSRKKIKNDKK